MGKDDFYQDKAWEMLMAEIGQLRTTQIQMQNDVQDIKEKMRWVFGLAAGVTLAVNIVWVFIKDRILK